MDVRRESSSQEDKESYLTLQQLDPEPVGFYEHDDKNSLSHQPLLPSWFHPLGLSSGYSEASGGKGSIYYLTQLQKYSSYAFTIFASFHITNTSLIPLLTRSVSASESYLLLTRPYYQSFPLESLIVGLPIIVHVTAGIAIRIHKRNVNLTRYGAICLPISTRLEKRMKIWPPISWTSLSGYLMIPIIGSHILVNRIIPWLYEGGSSSVGLGYVAHIFSKHPFLTYINYSIMISLFTSHFSWGFCRWNKLVISGNSKKARQRSWTINSISAALSLAWIAGGFGIVARGGRAIGWVGNGYDKLLKHLWL